MYFEKKQLPIFLQFYSFLHCLGHLVLEVKQTLYIRRCEFVHVFFISTPKVKERADIVWGGLKSTRQSCLPRAELGTGLPPVIS